MSQCHDCGDYVPVRQAVQTGLLTAGEAGKARNDIRGFNAFCRCEGLVNTTQKEDQGCACFHETAH
jgi:hypothetical protein